MHASQRLTQTGLWKILTLCSQKIYLAHKQAFLINFRRVDRMSSLSFAMTSVTVHHLMYTANDSKSITERQWLLSIICNLQDSVVESQTAAVKFVRAMFLGSSWCQNKLSNRRPEEPKSQCQVHEGHVSWLFLVSKWICGPLATGNKMPYIIGLGDGLRQGVIKTGGPNSQLRAQAIAHYTSPIMP